MTSVDDNSPTKYVYLRKNGAIIKVESYPPQPIPQQVHQLELPKPFFKEVEIYVGYFHSISDGQLLSTFFSTSSA